MAKEIEVEVADPSEGRRTYVGLEICNGPGLMRLLLTQPYRSAGQTVDIPVEQVEAVAQVANAPQGQAPAKKKRLDGLRRPGRGGDI